MASQSSWLSWYLLENVHLFHLSMKCRFPKMLRNGTSKRRASRADLSSIPFQWANTKKWDRGSSGGQFHTNHCILSTQASSLCLRNVVTVYFTVLPAKFNTVKPLLSPLGGLFVSSPFERGEGLINWEKMMVSVLPKEVEYKVEKLKYKKVGGTSTW